MHLDVTSLIKAVASLETSLKVLSSPATANLDRATREVIKAGVIQNFEFTYELSHKMLKRYLEMSSANPSTIEEMPFSDLIRTGREQGLLLTSWDVWKTFRKARSTTSHTYDEAKAKEILDLIPEFLKEARYLLGQLQTRAGGTTSENA